METKRKNVLRMLVLLTVLGFGTLFQLQANLAPPTPPMEPIAPTPPTPVAPLFGIQANLQTVGFFTESIEGKLPPTLYTRSEEYDGQQTVRGVINAFDAEYNRRYSKTRVIASRKGVVYSSELAISGEIDSRYPRAEWLQLLLDKGITIETFDDYRVYLSKRHTLAFLEDNPSLRKAELLGIPPADDWETYTASYIDKLAAKQIEHRKKQAERAKKQLKRTKAQIERRKKQLERAKEQSNSQQLKHIQAQLERAKKELEDARKQLKRAQEVLERAKKQTPQHQGPNRQIKKTSPYPPL